MLQQLNDHHQKDVQMDSIANINGELRVQLEFVQQQYEKVANELETLKCSKRDIDDRYESMISQLEHARQELSKQKLEHSNQIYKTNKTFIGKILIDRIFSI